MQKIRADSMTPAHVSPLIPKRVVLKEKVILAAKKDKTIGVVCPVLFRGEMHLWPIWLIIAGVRNGGLSIHRQSRERHHRKTNKQLAYSHQPDSSQIIHRSVQARPAFPIEHQSGFEAARTKIEECAVRTTARTYDEQFITVTN